MAYIDKICGMIALFCGDGMIWFKDVSVAFGDAPLLDKVNFSLEKGERVALIGRNGEGKSTLMKLITGQAPDDGSVIIKDGTKIGYLLQEVPHNDGTALETVLGASSSGFLSLQARCNDGDIDACARIGEIDGWQLKARAQSLLMQMGIDENAKSVALSGGKKRRLALACALIDDPDVLLLDEPTNHLDVQSIAKLEDFLLNSRQTLLFITHDRAFMDKIATSVAELDRGVLSRYAPKDGLGAFASYQAIKADELLAQEKQFALFDKKLAQEEAWIRQGIKARRTRNEGRVRALKQLRQARTERRDVQKNVQLEQMNSEASAKIICEVKDLSLGYGTHTLVKDFSAVLMRGDKVGIIGDNGVGKTTLIRTILGLDDSARQAGQVKLGARLNIAFFDQLRDSLELDKSIAENVAQGSDYVDFAGKRVHILGYLQDFLFSPKRARTPVSALSGGERARVLLAKNLLTQANVLVLDEPTNDLDMPTLEMLEAFLVEFDGTVLIITHDRAFMDNVATQIWAFEDGTVNEYAGGYADYLAVQARIQANAPKSTSTQDQKTQSTPSHSVSVANDKPTKKKLSYKESQELAQIPDKINALEKEQSDLMARLDDGSWFNSDYDSAHKASVRLGEIDEILLQLLERWEVLGG